MGRAQDPCAQQSTANHLPLFMRPRDPAMQAAPSTARIHRLELISRAREAVLCNGETTARILIDPAIERSWRRCLLSGLDPTQKVLLGAVSRQATRHCRDANLTLLNAAAPVMGSLARTMSHTGYFAILTDASGIVIDVQGLVDRQNPHVSAIARVGLAPQRSGPLSASCSPCGCTAENTFMKTPPSLAAQALPSSGPTGDALACSTSQVQT